MEWFRFWNGSLNSLKVQTLKPEVFKTWVNLLCLASQEDDGGLLPIQSEIAFSLRINDRTLTGHIVALIESGLLEEEEGGRLRVHDWQEWQPCGDDPAERMRRYRERKKANSVAQPLRNGERNERRNATRNRCAPRARSDSETDSETETEKDNTPLPPPGGNVVESSSPEDEPPEFPDALTTIVTIQTGDYSFSEHEARKIWGHLWRTWKDVRLCYGFYEKQRWCSVKGWLYSIEIATKQGQRPGSVKYLQKIGMNFDINGPKVEKPLTKGDIGPVPYKPTYAANDNPEVKLYPIIREGTA